MGVFEEGLAELNVALSRAEGALEALLGDAGRLVVLRTQGERAKLDEEITAGLEEAASGLRTALLGGDALLGVGAGVGGEVEGAPEEMKR